MMPCNHQSPPQTALSGGTDKYSQTDEQKYKRETVNNHKEMEAMLLSHSQDHFARAHGTDFTIEPLKSKLQYNGLTAFGKQITKGCLPEDIELPPMTHLLLGHQTCKL